MGGDPVNSELLAAAVAEAGAFIGGRRTYDDSLPWWGADGPTGDIRVWRRSGAGPLRASHRS
jgi:hypothetical protein